MRLSQRILTAATVLGLVYCASGAGNDNDAADPGYWRSHSVVYADIKSIVEPKGDEKWHTIVLRPQLRLTGQFDPGKVSEISARINWKKFGPFLTLTFHAKVLVLLQSTKEGYWIASERQSFMPGDHAPICEVKDFDDPKVKETLEAVQKLRHASDEANPKDEPAKH